MSLLVKQQYEESPYPRWMKAAPVGKATTIDGDLQRQFPLVSFRNIAKKSSNRNSGRWLWYWPAFQRDRPTNHWSAGACRGSKSDQSLLRKRKTRELGLNNIEYAQADILRLESIGRAFDVIEASGVLPSQWRTRSLVGGSCSRCLRPGGFMRLGLYSKLARQDLVDARKIIADRGYVHPRRTSAGVARNSRALVTIHR